MFASLLDLVGWAAFRAPSELIRRFADVRTRLGELPAHTRILVLTSFLWTLPFAFEVVYLRIFMREQGLTELQIGAISSTQVLFQLAGSFCGGFIADRVGWKNALIWIDLILWPSAMLSYANADSYGGFMLGACIEGAQWMVIPAWTSLLVAGTPPSKRPFLFAFSGLHFMGGGLIVPLLAPMIKAWGVSGASRVVFSVGASLMAVGVLVRWRMVKDMTVRHRLAGRASGFGRFIHGHLTAFRTIVHRPGLRLMFMYQVVIRTALIVGITYSYLFLTDPRGLALGHAQVAVLPMINSAMVVVTLLFVNRFITLASIHRFFYLGLAFRMSYLVALILAPPGAIGLMMGVMVVEGLGFGILWATTSAYWANQMTDAERPHITALANVLIMMLSMPAPVLAGALYGSNPRFPFLMMLVLFVVALGLQVWMDFMERKRGSGALLEGS